MKISILTPDSKSPNLAAMKISAFHKAMGDEISHNNFAGEYIYASVLFSKTSDPPADLIGGPKYPHSKLDADIEKMKPDYSFYPNIDYSLGYTYKACPRSCDFCIVPKQNNEETHYSIHDFHDPRFKKICLLNNNTLADTFWRETFDEILEANLKIKDQNGFDARLITDEVGSYIKKLKFIGEIHSAWDFMDHEEDIIKGLKILRKAKSQISCYVLIGETTHEENIYRIEKLKEMRITPYVMPLNKKDLYQRKFQRWVNTYVYKKDPWEKYKYKI